MSGRLRLSAAAQRGTAISGGRWLGLVGAVLVLASFGTISDGRATASAPAPAPTAILAASWQPAFCERRSRLPECRSQTADRFDARHFSLHGLWPQPRSNVYCGVADDLKRHDKAGNWQALPELPLPEALRRELERVMPGTASGLDRHEWIKHGTCHAGDPETYYRLSLELMQALNRSALRSFFAANLGRIVTVEAMREAADGAFGESAGSRIGMHCVTVDGRVLIVELRFHLSLAAGPQAGFADRLRAAPPVRSPCGAGEIDRVD